MTHSVKYYVYVKKKENWELTSDFQTWHFVDFDKNSVIGFVGVN